MKGPMKDNLLPIRTVFYRAYPDEEGEKLFNELDTLRAIQVPSEQQAERIQQIKDSNVLVGEYRYTVSKYSLMQRTRREALLARGQAWFKERAGISWSDHYAQPLAQRDQLRDGLTDVAWYWSAIIPAITLVEYRQVDLLHDSTPEWATSEVPDEWNDIEVFATLDGELTGRLFARTRELNPFLSGISQDEATKKFGVVTVI